MFRNSKVQMTAVLAVGVLCGYLAASGRFNPFQRTEAAEPIRGTAGLTPAQHGDGEAPPCCDEVKRRQLLALANPAVKEAVAAAQEKTGGKPNILFIMGDDIGWMQPGCYHRGLMVGETPSIDRIAAEGAMFMH
jgi:hypothetical protein